MFQCVIALFFLGFTRGHVGGRSRLALALDWRLFPAGYSQPFWPK